MNRTLTITAAEWASVQDGTLWLVGEGEEDDLDQFIREENLPVQRGPLHPPAEFVQACAPCETCGNQRTAISGGPGYFKGGRLRHLAGGQTVMEIRCPDCRIELVGSCLLCGGSGRRHGGPFGEDVVDCRCAMTAGLIVFGYGYAVGEPLRVKWVDDEGVVAENTDGADLSIPLDCFAHYGPSESLIGKWALQVQVVA